MDLNVIHHHIFHPNGFNPANSAPSNIPSSDAWHLYHHTFTDPAFNPDARFNPFHKLSAWLKPAPIYHYTFMYAPSMIPTQEIQKTDGIAQEQLAPQSNVREPENKEQESQNSEIVPQIAVKQPEKPAITKNASPAIVHEGTSKILDETLSLIQKGKAALHSFFVELDKKNPSSSTFKSILEYRNAFWNDLEKQAASNFSDLKVEIEKQMNVDTALSMVLSEEAIASEKQKIALKTSLGLIASYQNQDVFSYRIETAREKSNLALFTPSEEKEVYFQIMKILIGVEKKENAKFIQSLSKLEDRFAIRGFATVSEHYKTTILKFMQIDDMLSHEDADNYIVRWNAALKEFDLQHQLLLKLHEADVALEEFADTMYKQLDLSEEKRATQIFGEINEMTGFMKGREALRASIDVENYIRNIYEFIQKGAMKLKGN